MNEYVNGLCLRLVFWSGDNNVALSSSLNCNFLDPPWQTNRNDNPIIFLMAQFCFLQAACERCGVCFFFSFLCTPCFLHRHWQKLKSIFSHFCFSLHSFTDNSRSLFVFVVVMCVCPCTGQLKRAQFFFSGAEFTLSSLASFRLVLCCHFSLLWERYVHLFWKVFQTLTFGIFCCLSH